jgi:hypothetical protein
MDDIVGKLETVGETSIPLPDDSAEDTKEQPGTSQCPFEDDAAAALLEVEEVLIASEAVEESVPITFDGESHPNPSLGFEQTSGSSDTPPESDVRVEIEEDITDDFQAEASAEGGDRAEFDSKPDIIPFRELNMGNCSSTEESTTGPGDRQISSVDQCDPDSGSGHGKIHRDPSTSTLAQGDQDQEYQEPAGNPQGIPQSLEEGFCRQDHLANQTLAADPRSQAFDTPNDEQQHNYWEAPTPNSNEWSPIPTSHGTGWEGLQDGTAYSRYPANPEDPPQGLQTHVTQPYAWPERDSPLRLSWPLQAPPNPSAHTNRPGTCIQHTFQSASRPSFQSTSRPSFQAASSHTSAHFPGPSRGSSSLPGVGVETQLASDPDHQYPGDVPENPRDYGLPAGQEPWPRPAGPLGFGELPQDSLHEETGSSLGGYPEPQHNPGMSGSLGMRAGGLSEGAGVNYGESIGAERGGTGLNWCARPAEARRERLTPPVVQESSPASILAGLRQRIQALDMVCGPPFHNVNR